MITDTCQRWREHRESRRPAGEPIQTSLYEVASIDSATEAREFVERHHYAGTTSPPAHRFGIYNAAGLAGVAIFGPSSSMAAHRAVFPTLSIDEGQTLGRLVLLDEVPGNGESWFVARCFELLARRGVVGIESCADPQPRLALDGGKTHRGHVGTIYQALSGRYVGRTNPSSLRLLPDGTALSNRACGKIARREQGCEYSSGQLVKWGATPLRADEDALEWLRHCHASNQHHLKCEYMNCDRLDATKRGTFTLCAPHHVAVARARGDGEILRGPPRARMLVMEKKAKMQRLAQKVFKRGGTVKSNEQIRSEATLAAVSERALDAVMPNVFRAAPGLRELAAMLFGQMLTKLVSPEAPRPVVTMTVDARWDDFLGAWHHLACAIDWVCPHCGEGMENCGDDCCNWL